MYCVLSAGLNAFE